MIAEAAITTLGLALIVFFTTTVSAAIPLAFASWRKTKDGLEAAKAKERDYARQDEVANRVAEAARQTAEAAQLLLDRQALDSLKTAEAARLLLAANERVARDSGVMNGKLDDLNSGQKVIHDLVNSKMTESMQKELDAEIRSLVLMKENMDLRGVTEQSAHEIKTTEQRIAELRARMTDRVRQQQVIDDKKKL